MGEGERSCCHGHAQTGQILPYFHGGLRLSRARPSEAKDAQSVLFPGPFLIHQESAHDLAGTVFRE